MKEQTEVGNNAEILREPDDYEAAEIQSDTPCRFIFKGHPPVSGKKENPLKIFIYGKNGIGKSTFASKMDKPVFLDLERNADHLATDRYPLDSFKDVELFLYELKNQKHAYETVVIDSVDVLERLAFEYVRKHFSDDLEWGKEYSHVLDCFSNIVKRCNLVFTEKKMNMTSNISARSKHTPAGPPGSPAAAGSATGFSATGTPQSLSAPASASWMAR